MSRMTSLFLIALAMAIIHREYLAKFFLPPARPSHYTVETDIVTYLNKDGDDEDLEHKIMRARIIVPPSYGDHKFVDYSRRLLDFSVKSKAEDKGIKNIWIEFYYDKESIYDQVNSKPYRVKYFRNGDAWVRIARVIKHAPQEPQSVDDDRPSNHGWITP